MPSVRFCSMCILSTGACSTGLQLEPKRAEMPRRARSSFIITFRNSLPRSLLRSIGKVFDRIAQRKKARRRQEWRVLTISSKSGALVVAQR